MSRFWQRGLALFSACAVLGLTGLPLAVIQAWGWGTMFARYLEIMPVEDALEFTFSGQDLCGYCEFVSRSTEAEKTQATLQVLQEMRLVVSFPATMRTAPPVTTQGPPQDSPRAGKVRPREPSEPPPRSGLPV